MIILYKINVLNYISLDWRSAVVSSFNTNIYLLACYVFISYLWYTLSSLTFCEISAFYKHLISTGCLLEETFCSSQKSWSVLFKIQEHAASSLLLVTQGTLQSCELPSWISVFSLNPPSRLTAKNAAFCLIIFATFETSVYAHSCIYVHDFSILPVVFMMIPNFQYYYTIFLVTKLFSSNAYNTRIRSSTL